MRCRNQNCELIKFLSRTILLSSALVFGGAFARAQTEANDLRQLLGEEILPPAVAEFQVRQYIINGTAAPPKLPSTSEEWNSQAARLRRHLLDDVAFHGWPREWVDSAPKFEDVGVIETGGGYRIHKLRYEVVPGLESAALLYVPDHPSAKLPAILNVNGHVGSPGKSVEYKQKRCITYAKHGILALNLEWFSFGELDQKGNEHWFGAHLDLVGANELGIFYLEMRRGLDYLYNYPGVDRGRLGVTGLSGGGWQTIVLSSLDERVKASNPVAGFSSLRSRVEAKHYGDMGDVEQSATDFLRGSDYPHLVALRAPRPTLLTYNAEDDCCFRAALVKPLVYDAVRPFFQLDGKQDVFDWHENRDPSTHNYQLDNRLADYRFFTKQFGLPPIENENGVASEIKSYDELVVGLPKNNLTLLALAQKLGREAARDRVPSDASAKTAWSDTERNKLKEVVRYRPVLTRQVWGIATSKNKGLQTTSYLFEMNNNLSANGVWLQSILQSSDTAPVTVVLDDGGRQAAADVISDRVNRGEQVFALDLMFTGSSWKDANPYLFAEMLDGIGDRPIGMEAAQLITLSRWARQRAGVAKVRLEAGGIRSQAVGLVAASLEPGLFSEIVVRNGMHSLSYLLDAPVTFQDAPDLFCLDLYRYFDIDVLQALAAPAKVSVTRYVELPQK